MSNKTDRRHLEQKHRDSNEVIERFSANRDLAARLAARYAHRSNHDDMRQVADLALLMASRRYDPDQGAFERFAVVTIIGELKKFLRSTGWAVRVPRRLQEDALVVSATVDRLTVTQGRSPRLSEVATACGLTPERVSEALRAGSARFAVPHDLERRQPDVEPEGTTLALAVGAAVAELADDAQALLAMIFVEGLSQREASARVGISQSQIQRRMTKILASLERPLLDLAEDR